MNYYCIICHYKWSNRTCATVARIILLPTTMLASEQTPERKRSAPGTPITHARRAETAGINRRQRKRTGAHEVITLDVRVKGGSRPMQFPLRSSVRDIIDTICTYHYFEDDNNISLYSMRSGIWMAPNRTLASYWLDNLVRERNFLHSPSLPHLWSSGRSSCLGETR